ncbi:MAG: hypothetical protein KatS3mg014_1688 [Actinomycetota bacterium]|nr:MAG: hypothetical protein KatS3mg014_1688 [Actinomycetota bacterium]
MARYGMVIDLDRCTGCRGCMESCKIENNTPQGSYWMYVFRFEEGEFPATKVRFMPRPCQHCDNAPCVKVCPVGRPLQARGRPRRRPTGSAASAAATARWPAPTA